VSTPFLISYIALWILVVVQAAGLLALYHHFGQMYLSSPAGRVDQGPDLGSSAEVRELADVDGDPIAFPPSPSIVVFADTECRTCAALKPTLAEFGFDTEIDLVVVCAGDSAEFVAAWAAAIPEPIRVVADVRRKLSTQMRVGVTPYLLAFDGAGRVCDKGVLGGRDDLDRAVSMARQSAPVVVKGR
jgi:hypothetical protein